MIYAESGNRVVEIHEEEIDKYVEQGYKVFDGNGNLVHDAIPKDIPNLTLAFKQHVAEINELKKRIAELENAKTAKKQTVVVDEPKVEETKVDEVEDIEIPKEPKTRKRKTEVEA